MKRKTTCINIISMAILVMMTAVVFDQSALAEPIEDFAAQFNYLYGRTYDCKLEDFGTYDFSDIPLENLGYSVYDLDLDGKDELIVAALNMDYTLRIDIYNEKDGEVVNMDSCNVVYQFPYDGRERPVQLANYTDGITDIFIYDNEGPCIGIEESGYGVYASGVSHMFLEMKYNGGKVWLQNQYYLEGPVDEYEDYSVGEPGPLEFFGVTDINYNDFWHCDTCVREHVGDVEEICRIMPELIEREIRVLRLTFLSKDELQTSVRESGRAADESEAEAAADNAEEAYHDFLVKGDFPYEFRPLVEQSYGIADIEDDGIPELIIKGKAEDSTDWLYMFYSFDEGRVKFIGQFTNWANRAEQFYVYPPANAVVVYTGGADFDEYSAYQVSDLQVNRVFELHHIFVWELEGMADYYSFYDYTLDLDDSASGSWEERNNEITENDWNYYLDNFVDVEFRSIRDLAFEDEPLTDGVIEVSTFVEEGLSTREIGERLGWGLSNDEYICIYSPSGQVKLNDNKTCVYCWFDGELDEPGHFCFIVKDNSASVYGAMVGMNVDEIEEKLNEHGWKYSYGEYNWEVYEKDDGYSPQHISVDYQDNVAVQVSYYFAWA